MDKKSQLLAVLTQASAAPGAGANVVGRLLTPIETDLVAGGTGSGDCDGDQDHNQGSGPFTQSGGDYFQNNSPYNMSCPKEQ